MNDNPVRDLSAVPELSRARSRSVRLIISIPVLTLLIVLGAGTVLHVYLTNLAEESPWFLPQTRLSLERAALIVLLLSMGISIVASAIGYVLARQIVRPIRELMGTMDAIAEGDLTTKVQPISLGEFGQLGMKFNRMMDQLNTLFEERDRQLHKSLTGGHIIVERSGRVLEADAAAHRIFAMAHSDLLGANLIRNEPEIPLLTRNRDFPAVLEETIEATLRGQPSSRTLTLGGTKADEPGRYLLSSLRLDSSQDGGQRVMLEFRDMSGIESFYEQIQRADRLAAVGTLATGIAHEVRNPLASIRGMVQLMSEAPPQGGEARDYHERILREVDRVDKLIAEIMDFAHADETPAELVNLNALLKDVATAARMAAGDSAANVELTWRLDDALPQALLRSERLRQALLNLVLNAFQHCGETGRGPLRIETHYRADELQHPILILVCNPGAPLDDQMRERIFEPFFTTKAVGTGLGLPIAYQMIQSNGGILEVRCPQDQIEFCVRLPLDAEAGSTSRAIKRLG